PASVLVNDEMEILRFWGRSSCYMQHSTGRASLNLMKLINKDLSMDLRAALQAAESKKTGKKKNVRFRYDGRDRYTDMEVIRVRGAQAGDNNFLIIFEEALPETHGASEENAEPAHKKRNVTGNDQRDTELAYTKEELEKTREYLQSVIEGQETVNEELKSSLEELQSSNEELQSTNEELETAKEELESTNEELSTVNEEMEKRNAEIDRINNDLLNLLGSVDISIIMLGEDLCIRRFNSTARKVMSLIPGDVGRKFTDIKPTVDIPDAKKMILDVMDSLKLKELEVQDASGKWYSVRIRPYVTLDKKIEGVVITVVDIDQAKKISEQIKIIARFPEEDPNPVLRVARNGKLLYANKAAALLLDKWKIGAGEIVPEKWRKPVKAALNSGSNMNMEPEEVKDLFFSFLIAPVVESGYANLYGRDITLSRKAEQIKDTLIRDTAHTLKTPVATAKMACDRCSEAFNVNDRDTINRMHGITSKSLQLMQDNITNILDSFRLEQGIKEPKKKHLSLRKIINDILTGKKNVIEEKKLKLDVNVAGGADKLYASSGEMTLLMNNLIENAVKFTEKAAFPLQRRLPEKLFR
ncbi:MAG: PAS domain-containing protein, partial [Candidatus Omnitrophota bacterium]